MQLTIEQAFKYATEEHKKNNLVEAERVYRQILKVRPKHDSTNHNLGLILVNLHQSENALPFLMTALEENKQGEQLWISYIHALINLDELDKASEFIELARSAGFSSEKFELLSTTFRFSTPETLSISINSGVKSLPASTKISPVLTSTTSSTKVEPKYLFKSSSLRSII